MKLWVNSDEPKGAARAVATAAIRRRHEIVSNIAKPDAVYVRTHTFPPWRNVDLLSIATAHTLGIPSIPSYSDSLLYDDKLAQVAPLQQWLPPTLVLRSRDEARAALVAAEDFIPFVSKSARGASSQNVRLIRDPQEAMREIEAVFGAGLQAIRELQRGYLIWQKYVPHQHDIRVVVTGDYLFGLRRGIRDDPRHPFASGSGLIEPILTLDTEASLAFRMAVEIAASLGSRWSCYDFVSSDDQLYALEVSTSWVEPPYDRCVLFTADREPTTRTAQEWPEIAVDELEALCAP